MIHLLANGNDVEKRLRAADHIFLFSDFDGTLTFIVERPEMAYPSLKIKSLLQELSKNRRFTVGIISGRALTDLKHRVGVRDIIYAGNHGLEIEGPGFNFIDPVGRETVNLLKILYRLLNKAFTGIKGVLIEDKGLSLSIHYRSVPEKDISAVKHTLDKVTGTAQMLEKIKITTGKKVYEIRPPANWDKGRAINWLLERYADVRDKHSCIPIFMGDDLTDEDGFKSVNRKQGISIFVGDEETVSNAQYFVRSPDEVERFLELLVNLN